MQKRGSIVGGLFLILLGILFLSLQFFPEMAGRLDLGRQWPLIVMLPGVIMLAGALLGAPPLAVPGSIVSGIGAILYYQNVTGNWASWAYVWTLIPGFVGLGILLMALRSGEKRPGLADGVRLMVISLVLFAVFGAFFSGLGGLGRYWPVLLIGLGIWILIQRRR